MVEKEYRALPIDSYSSFKDFIEDRKKYYRKYVLGEKIEEKDETVMRMGNVVETIRLSPNEFDNKFIIATSKIPSGNMLDFTEAVYKRTMQNTTEEGELVCEMEDILRQAYNDVKYDAQGNIVAFKQAKVGSFEAIVIKFKDECNDYYKELLASRARGLTLISAQDLENGQKVSDELATHPNTAAIFSRTTNEEWLVEIQVAEIFEIQDYKTKGLLDLRHTNHKEKTIQPYDLKVTWNVDEFEDKYYFYRRSDIQAAIYYLGTLKWRDENYPEYTVLPMKFIVADSIGYNAPLVYDTTYEDVQAAMTGYIRNGREYKGLYSTIEDLKWHKESGIWNISRENFENKGLRKIRRTYDFNRHAQNKNELDTVPY